MGKQMDQSKSTKKTENKVPRRNFTTEIYVGFFVLLTLIGAGYLSLGLGGLEIDSGKYYRIEAEFDNISGLNKGASVEIAGVQIGTVEKIRLDDSTAVVTLKINKDVKIKDDDIAQIRTEGIMGDRFVKISRGSSSEVLKDGDSLFDTESVVDFEDLIGKVIHNFTSDDKDDKDKKE